MHAESNALRQSFAPQSMLRSSWSQLVIAGLDPAIHKHKALAHDMHAESNALRQSFVPQPMLRSSWLQLVIPVLGTGIQKEMFGSRPNMTVRKKAEHDGKEKGRT